MNASHEGGVRTLDERPSFRIERVSRFPGRSARRRRGPFASVTPLDVFGAVGDAFADEDADVSIRDALDRPVDSEATPRGELDGEDAHVAPDDQTAPYRIVGR